MFECKYSADFDKIFNYTRKICDGIGIDVLRKDFRFTWKTFCVFVVINAGIGLCFYTMYADTIAGNYNYIFKAGSIMGTGIQVNLLRHPKHNIFSFVFKI